MNRIKIKRKLFTVSIVAMIALFVFPIQATFAADKTFYSSTGQDDGTAWPYKHSFGTVKAGDPQDSYHMSINHWNPASNGAITMAFDDATIPIGFQITDWEDNPSATNPDFSQSASVVYHNGSQWVWSTLEGESSDGSWNFHAPCAYPNAHMGCHWGQCTYDSSDNGKYDAGIPFPIRARDINNLNSTFNITVGGDSDNGVWNAAFDIWLDTGDRRVPTGEDGEGFPVMPGYPGALRQRESGDQGGQNNGAEIMIWMNYRGYARNNGNPITPAGDLVATNVQISGVEGRWDVWAARSGSVYEWNVISYVRIEETGGNASNPNVTSMTFDANLFIQDAIYNRECPTESGGSPVAGNPCVSEDWWVTSVPAGFEIWARGQGLKINEFSVKPDTDVEIDAGRTTDTGDPLIHWNQKFVLRHKPACSASEVEYTISDSRIDTADITGTMTMVASGLEGGRDMWADRAGPIYPNHNDATVTFTTTCTDGTTQTEVVDVYIDPSGVVVNTFGEPVENAEVILHYAEGIASSDPEPSADAFEPVPDGSAIMSPENRNNPDLTNEIGYYRWDVQDGWYKVTASHPDCTTSAESPALPVSEGNPATNVNIVLECIRTNDLTVELTDNGDVCKNVFITNNGSEPVDWVVTFEFDEIVDANSFWNANLISQNGNQITIEGVDWNNILKHRETTHSIGFCIEE